MLHSDQEDIDENDDELFALTITPWPVATFQKVSLTEKVALSQNRNQFPPAIIRNDDDIIFSTQMSFYPAEIVSTKES